MEPRKTTDRQTPPTANENSCLFWIRAVVAVLAGAAFMWWVFYYFLAEEAPVYQTGERPGWFSRSDPG